MQLEVKTKIRIGAPVHQVYEAIVGPAKMSQYFITAATGPMEAGKNISWSWADYNATTIITVQKIETDRFSSFTWPGSGVETTVDLELTKETDAITVVNIREYGWKR